MKPSEDAKQNAALPVETAHLGKGGDCRGIIAVAVRSFLSISDMAATNGVISLSDLQRIAHAVMDANGALGACYNAQAAICAAYFEVLAHEQKQITYFGHVITQPLSQLLDDPDSGIEQKNLSQYFAAVRMIVGDDKYTEYRERCVETANRLRASAQSMPWDDFYGDPQMRAVLEEVQVAIANSFQRFETRKEWFLVLMNTDPESVSLSANSFVPKKSSDKLTQQFTDLHFITMFKALFASVQPNQFDKEREAAFTKKYGKSSQSIFGPLFVELTALGQSYGSSSFMPRTKRPVTREKLAKVKHADPPTWRTAAIWASAIIALCIIGYFAVQSNSPTAPTAKQLVKQMELAAQGEDLPTHILGGTLRVVRNEGMITVTANDVPSSVCISAGWTLARKGIVSINGLAQDHVTGVILSKACTENGASATVSVTFHQ